MANSSITWCYEKIDGLTCPVCFDKDKKVLVLQTSLRLSNKMDLYRCPHCGTCFYYPSIMASYENAFDRNYIKYYVECGAGIDSMLEPLHALSKNKNLTRLLDVGCGCGFTLDFAEKCFGWETAGIEPSSFGQLGVEELGLQIYNDYLENIRELDNRQFDIVFSSEVIEHVENPRNFLANLTRYLSPVGVLVLTTPNAHRIEEATPFTTLLALLSPGLHINILSTSAIEILLRDIGFRYIRIIEKNEKLLVFASQKEFQLYENKPKLLDDYINFLQRAVQCRKNQDMLYDGFSFRLFKELVNRGEYERAKTVLIAFKQSLVSKYGEEVFIPATLGKIVENASTFEELGDHLPYHMTELYYYVGMLYLNFIKDYEHSAAIFHHAFEVSNILLERHSQFFQPIENLLWRMKYHEGLALLYAQKPENALDIFESILERNESKYIQAISLVLPSQEIVVNCLYNAGIAELQLGHFFKAAGRFQQTIESERQGGSSFKRVGAARHLGITMTQWIDEVTAQFADAPEVQKAFLREITRSIKKRKSTKHSFLEFLTRR